MSAEDKQRAKANKNPLLSIFGPQVSCCLEIHKISLLQQETETEVASSGAEGETSEADSLGAKSFDQYLACQEKAVHLNLFSNHNPVISLIKPVCNRPVLLRKRMCAKLASHSLAPIPDRVDARDCGPSFEKVTDIKYLISLKSESRDINYHDSRQCGQRKNF